MTATCCIKINHVGFPPGAVKTLVFTGRTNDCFHLYRLHDTKFTLVFTGALQQHGNELGEGLVGDFSAWNEEGIYRIECADAVSHCFVIGRDVYRYENSFDPRGQGLSNEYDLPMGGWLAWLFSTHS